ncbi:hypothetical protein [Leptospira kmetyi]|uniref:Uncharacterized protein n=1 Tax=Leptospira kmetyi TaxID=408139 RepID=A0ABX4N887_9LEPT|nr:hypothetical protein [Leptospira kmetyi]PJZ28302.1 hypothetical protein CH378_18435 [Leptospira kmetyi]
MKMGFIKAAIFFVLTLNCSVIQRNAEPSANNALDILRDTRVGEYVYYLDHRSPKNLRIIGILRIDETSLAVRSKSLDSKDESIMIGHFALMDGKLIFFPDKILKGENTHISVDLSNWGILLARVNRNRLVETDRFEVEDPWPEFGYTLMHHFAIWSPIFRLTSTRQKNSDGLKGITIIKVGSVEKVKTFFEFEYLPVNVKEVSKITYDVPASESREMEIWNIRFKLDGNWKSGKELGVRKGEDDSFYGLALATARDAEFNITAFRLYSSNTKVDTLLRSYIGGIDGVDYSSIRHSLYKGYSRVDFDTYAKGRKPNKFIYIFVPGEKVCRIISFSSFKQLYISNPTYFETIMNSIEVDNLAELTAIR